MKVRTTLYYPLNYYPGVFFVKKNQDNVCRDISWSIVIFFIFGIFGLKRANRRFFMILVFFF